MKSIEEEDLENPEIRYKNLISGKLYRYNSNTNYPTGLWNSNSSIGFVQVDDGIVMFISIQKKIVASTSISYRANFLFKNELCHILFSRGSEIDYRFQQWKEL